MQLHGQRNPESIQIDLMVVGSTLITRNRSCGWRIICSGLAQCKSGSGSNEEKQDFGHANISKVSLGILSNDIDKRYWQIVRASHIAIQASLGSMIKKEDEANIHEVHGECLSRKFWRNFTQKYNYSFD